jgi:hypothetical protein
MEPSESYRKESLRRLTGGGWVRPSSEEGIALVMVLILSAISLAVMSALVYMLVVSTQSSGAQKRYKTALEAGKAGREVIFNLISGRGTLNMTGLSNFAMANQNVSKTVNGIVISQNCLAWKLTYPTAMWPSECSTSLSINPDDSLSSATASYDMSVDVGSAAVYRVRAKIVDTVDGNSGANLGLRTAGVVASNNGEISVPSRPYLYTIEVDSENRDNPVERGKYEILYQY